MSNMLWMPVWLDLWGHIIYNLHMSKKDFPVNPDESNTEEYFTKMQRCTKCILPSSFPGIVFNEQGICNYCLQHVPVSVYGEAELKRVLSQYRGKGDKYDCILTLSGGRDSAFVMHQIQNESYCADS
jgi:hypothetical protein